MLVYDLRGHGLTDRPASGYRLDDQVADLAAVLDAHDVHEPVVLVGNSFGGTIALHAALTRPDLVAGICLVEAHPVVAGWGSEIMEDLEEMVAGFDEPGVREFITGDGGRKLKKMAATCEGLVSGTSLAADLRAESPMTPNASPRSAVPRCASTETRRTSWIGPSCSLRRFPERSSGSWRGARTRC